MKYDVISLIIFLLCIVVFVIDKLPMATTAILGCVLMVVFGCGSFSQIFNPFASSTVILTIGVMVIGAAISNVGLASVVGDWIIKISKGSETKLLIGTYLISVILSSFLTNSAVLAIFIPIIMSLSKENKNIRAKRLIMPIAMGCILGGLSTLVGSTQQMTAQGLLEDAGLRTFKTFDFSVIGAILVVAGLIYCLTIGNKIASKIWQEEENLVEIKEFKGEYNKVKIIIMAIIFAITILFYITEWIPIAITSTSSALLCIITGCISQKKAFNSVNWNIVGRLAGCLGIAKGLEISGGTKLISSLFSNIVGPEINVYLLFCILIFLVQFTSEFISNSTAILIVLPIVIAIAPDFGLNTFSFALGITIASGTAFSCPLASSTLGMSMSVGYKFNDYFKYSFLFDIISYIIIIVLVPLLYGLTA